MISSQTVTDTYRSVNMSYDGHNLYQKICDCFYADLGVPIPSYTQAEFRNSGSNQFEDLYAFAQKLENNLNGSFGHLPEKVQLATVSLLMMLKRTLITIGLDSNGATSITEKVKLSNGKSYMVAAYVAKDMERTNNRSVPGMFIAHCLVIWGI